MGDHAYDYDSNSSFLHCNIPPSSSDEISLLLNQIMYRSSSSTSTPPKAAAMKTTATTNSAVLARMGLQAQTFSSPPEDGSHGPLSKSQRISAGVFLSGNVRLTGVNVSSSSVAVGENETNEDHDCESEEGIEAAVDEGPAKVAPRSKRSRAAEVHNLSEKRRRSRINEKMKALQNLIPNSNKTDKASMLDEAIEYLKQLQLQVQMLTMKNGLSLHPMCLPGALQPFQFSQMRTGFGGDNGSGTLTMTQETPTQSLFSLPSQSTATNQLQVSNLINSGTSFGLDSSIQAQFGPFLLRTSSEDICREDMFSNQQLNVNHSETNPSDAALLPFNTQDSDLKDSASLEACVMARSRRESVRSKNLEHNLICTFPTLNWVKVLSLQTGRSLPGDDCKLERNNL